MAITGLTQLWQPSEFPRSSVGWWWPWELDIILCLIPMAFTFLRMTPKWTTQCVLIILGLGLTSEAFTNYFVWHAADNQPTVEWSPRIKVKPRKGELGGTQLFQVGELVQPSQIHHPDPLSSAPADRYLWSLHWTRLTCRSREVSIEPRWASHQTWDLTMIYITMNNDGKLGYTIWIS